MGTLFKNGTVITAGEQSKADVLVEGEIVTLIGMDIEPDGHEVVDCTGKYVLPGGIDVHTHLDLAFGGTYSNDDFDTGHKAAAFGGTTMTIDFAMQKKGGTLHEAIDIWNQKAKLAQLDYSYHIGVTDLRPDVMDEIGTLPAEGFTSLKLFMAYKNVFQIDDATLFKAMQKAASLGMLILVHAENGDVETTLTPELIAAGKTDPVYHAASRPREIEGEATNRAVVMSGMTGCRLYVVHVTNELAVDAIRRGRAMGYPVMGETCIQYFFLTVDEHLAQPDFHGAKYVCSPPIRTKHDQQVLWQAVRDNSLQIVSTDHCDFWFDGGHGPTDEWAKAHNGGDWAEFEAQDPSYRRPGKELGKGNFAKIPNGLPAIEDRLMMLWNAGVNTGKISPSRFVELNCTNPAKIFGMYPQKGTIAVGSDADIAVWDPNQKHVISASTHHMRTDYNLFEGTEVTGVPVLVYSRGKKLVDGDQWFGKNGDGKRVMRTPDAAIL